jgi:adenylate cyclase
VESKASWTSCSNSQHYIRIYRADGSFILKSFPLGTTAAELIADLVGAPEKKDGKKIATNMKLYVRERGQDRQLLPSERPLMLQARRLLQAGYSVHEHIEELGKEDISMLCRFIYQTPVLPIINPEEESSYESFEFIDLSARDLQTIPIFLHLHADNIIILNVSRNPMTDIPLDFIQACTSLKELRMTNMALKRVPGSIRASTTLSRLDLSCNRISDLESAHLHDIGTLLSLKVQNNRLSSIPTYFLQMKALKYLNISNNTFETFPTVVCEMSNLVDLDISFNQIAALPPQMSDLKSLERLTCVGNELTEFPKSFSTLANLRVLDVRRNKLVDLTPVYALPNLATLRADRNDLVTLDTQLGSKVRDFSVPHNSITRFTLAPMPGLTAAYSLTHLNLAHAKISTLEESALADLVNLIELNLSFNQFTRLPQTIDRLQSLEVFSCTDNMLASLPPNCFGKAQRLRECNLHNNNLKELPVDIWLCSSIELINVSSNLLELLPSPPSTWEALSPQEPPRKFSTVSHISALSSVTTSSDKSRRIPPAGVSLKSLFLADNRLTEDVFHQIALLSSLRVLNVSFNDIVEVPPYTLRRCDKLEALYLSGNKLTSLPAEDIEMLQNLRILHLNGNRLQTLPSEIGALKNLEHLDVGSNVLKYNIANWPYDWNWNWNTALRYLNLSGNKRLEIKPTSGQELTHSHPNQQHFRRELSDFTALTHLRVLGLMDVTLRIPSLPDESDEKRVRTSFSNLNNMAYGISDMLGSIEHLAMFDLAVPNFRGAVNECVFGMFGRATPTVPAGKIPKYIQEHFSSVLAEQLRTLQPGEVTTEALRRTFLMMNRMAYDSLAGLENRPHDSVSSGGYGTLKTGPNLHSQLRTGASGAIVYLVDKTLHVANAGDALVIISRKGEAELLGKKHDPTDRDETARIRSAEAWVSPKGLVNDEKDIDISRAFGFYQALPAVNASPEVRTRHLTEVDEFVIVGNSALWNCCTYQTAVDIARTERDDPMIAAQKLRDFAISYGAEGSVMVMVVNVSDIFNRNRNPTPGLPTELGVDSDYLKRAQRRKAEEVGDRTLNRLQQEIEPPTGQVAIVFTDIVNSTALWETNPGMPTAIKMHHNLMRRQLRLDGGYEVKTEGDSFMVSFQSVTAALLWAFNCQIVLLQQEWPRELLESEDGRVIYDSKSNIIHRGLRVRMGVHWGAPECERDPITRRMDYYGPMVNRAARINASADGGQLMASQDVINEIRALREHIESSDEHTLDELSSEVKREVQELRRIGGIEFKDMGERKLKGLEVPEKLSLLYPKTLAGRLELNSGLRANVEVSEARVFASERNIAEARQLVAVMLRLEALCFFDASPPERPVSIAASAVSAVPASPAQAPHTHPALPTELISLAAARRSISGPSAMAAIVSPVGSPMSPISPTFAPGASTIATFNSSSGKALPPTHLGPTIRDHMTEEELLEVIASVTTRIENALSTLYLKQLGGLTAILAALGGRRPAPLYSGPLGAGAGAGVGAGTASLRDVYADRDRVDPLADAEPNNPDAHANSNGALVTAAIAPDVEVEDVTPPELQVPVLPVLAMPVVPSRLVE